MYVNFHTHVNFTYLIFINNGKKKRKSETIIFFPMIISLFIHYHTEAVVCPMNCETKVRVEVKLVAGGTIVVLTTVELRQASCVMGSATRRPIKQAIFQ